MLDKTIFTRGLQLINAVCIKQIETQDTIEIFYHLLQDLSSEHFIPGIQSLMKRKKDIHIYPSPAEIIDAVQHISREDNKKPLEIFDFIRRDIILFGKNQPKYRKKIKEIIDKIGGWDSLRFASDADMDKYEQLFIQEYFKYQETTSISSSQKSLEMN